MEPNHRRSNSNGSEVKEPDSVRWLFQTKSVPQIFPHWPLRTSNPLPSQLLRKDAKGGSSDFTFLSPASGCRRVPGLAGWGWAPDWSWTDRRWVVGQRCSAAGWRTPRRRRRWRASRACSPRSRRTRRSWISTTIFCSIRLPLASTRWVQLTLSSLWPLA